MAFLDALAVVGNPSSIHRDGQRARMLLEDARAMVAASLGCDPIEVVFTSGGTESVNLGISGLYRARRASSPARVRLIVPEGEHHATIDTVEWLEKHEGAVIEWIPLDSLGRISVDAWRNALERSPETIALATCLWANNEVGTIQPVADLAALAESAGVPLHVDAVAAWGHESLSEPVATRAITALSVAGHKVGSVPGIGALYVSRSAQLEPLIHGGGQQRGLRSGTQNEAAASSLAAAITAAVGAGEPERERLRTLRDDAQWRILSAVDGVTVSGDAANRLENNLHLVVDGASSADMLYLLDEAGISVSAGSACQAGVARPSHVLLAMGHSEVAASNALRITLGHTTTSDDIDALVSALPTVIAKARAVSSRT
jgi:cysteine desulfurase